MCNKHIIFLIYFVKKMTTPKKYVTILMVFLKSIKYYKNIYYFP